MPNIIVTPAAENDLTNIWLYIAEDNPLAADKVFDAAQATFNSLSEKQEIGKVYESRREKLKGIRFFPIIRYPKYVIYYRKIGNGIEVIRVLHAHMLKESRLEF